MFTIDEHQICRQQNWVFCLTHHIKEVGDDDADAQQPEFIEDHVQIKTVRQSKMSGNQSIDAQRILHIAHLTHDNYEEQYDRKRKDL